MKIGIIGSGSVGSRLGKLLTSAGHLVLIGSRSDKTSTPVDAANHGEVVIFAIPYDATAETLPTLAEILAGKIVVDATNPLKSDCPPSCWDRTRPRPRRLLNSYHSRPSSRHLTLSLPTS